jgi:DNA-binding NarL/FixJ family response regulator
MKYDVLIAVADDNDTLRGQLSLFLELSGFSVIIVARNGLDCLHQMEVAVSLPDICLLDIHMPVMNGFEAACQIKKTWPAVKLLFYSTDSGGIYMRKAKQIGVDAFLGKDRPVDELVSVIEELMVKRKGEDDILTCLAS